MEKMKLTNKFNLPSALVNAIDLERHNEKGCLSATTLNKGVKEIILTDRHFSEIEVEVANCVWQVFGNAVHSLFSNSTKDDTFKEEYFEDEIGNHRITGRVDCYDMKNATLYDWKTASVWKVKMGDFSDWYRQGSIYAWLMWRAGLEVERVRFVAFLKDHSKTEAARDEMYPQYPLFVYEFEVTDVLLRNVQDMLEKKESEISEAELMDDDDIEPCTMEERWGSPHKWAAMKQGRKTAVKLYDSKEDCEKRIEREGSGWYMEERKGYDRKCEGYCPVAKFCSYYKSTHNN